MGADDQRNLSALPLTVETGHPEQSIHVRRATIRLNGVSIFSELVFDTNEAGERTEEQAKLNVTRVFADRLSRLLEDADV